MDKIDQIAEKIMTVDTAFFVANGDLELTKQMEELVERVKNGSLSYASKTALERTKLLKHVLSKYPVIREQLRQELSSMPSGQAMAWEQQAFSDPLIDARFEFPWQSVKPGCRLVIYGGGVVGRTVLHQLMKIPYCKTLAICDRNPAGTGVTEVPVITLKQFAGWDSSTYDTVLIANEREQIAREIRSSLELAGIELRKVKWINPARNA